jgi:hypothetical protein
MASTTFLPRQFIILAIVLPLALLLGYLIATPDTFGTVAVVGLLIGTLLIPLLLRWHHPLVILAWNATISVFVLPGQPALWMVLAGMSFGVSVLERGLNKKTVNTYIPSIVWPLVILVGVVLVTAKFTGGIGLRAAGGSAYGGKRYFFIFTAVLGYFALTSQRVSLEKAKWVTAGFFGSALTALMSNIIYFLGPAFYFLYSIFPVGLALEQAFADFSLDTQSFTRLVGVGQGGPSLIYLLFIAFGIRGIFSVANLWRPLVLLGCFCLTLFGGFRSGILMLVFLFGVQFFLEGLHRTRLVLFLALGLIIGAGLVLPFANRLPLSVQRSLSFLPIEVDPVARSSAEASTQWRIEMWQTLVPQIPKYLFLGKGCSIDPTELYLLNQAIRAGFYGSNEESLFVGSYHNGPLTLLISFGLPGTFAFLWFAFASLRVLYRHYANSPPELRLVNTFLLSYFFMRLVFFLIVYGQFAEDLWVFTGVVGLSVSINGNLKKTVLVEVSQTKLRGAGGEVIGGLQPAT